MSEYSKNKIISVRITEAQLLNLTNALQKEQINKSEFLRECIKIYGSNYRIKEVENNYKLPTSISLDDTENPK